MEISYHSQLDFSLYIYIYFFETEFHSCCPSWRAMVQSQLTATSTSWAPAILPASASRVAEIHIGTCHHIQIFFCIFSKRGFHHVGQAGLKLLTSGNPSASPPKVLGLQVSHHTWPSHFLMVFFFSCKFV